VYWNSSIYIEREMAWEDNSKFLLLEKLYFEKEKATKDVGAAYILSG